MTTEKSFSTPKSRKRKGYRARKDINRAAIKKRRSDNAEFCKAENESLLERFNIQSGPLIVNPQGTMLSCSYYKDFILSRLASVFLL